MERRELAELLDGHPTTVLRAIAAAHGLEPANRREALIEQLAAALPKPEVIARFLARLSPEERALLDWFVGEGGLLPAHRVQRDPGGGEVRQLGVGALERLRPWEAPASPTERLWYGGLIFPTFGEKGEFRGQLLCLPDDLLPLLPPGQRPSQPFELEPPHDGAPPMVREAAHYGLAIVEDAFAALSEVQRHGGEAEGGRSLPFEALQRLNSRLLLSEPGNWQSERETQRLGLLLHLLRGLRLLTVQADGSVALQAQRVRRWLQAPRDRRLLSLQRAWREDPTWNELWRVPELRVEPTGWRNDPFRTRQRFLHWLAQVPPGQWVTIGSFTRAIKSTEPDFQRPDGDYDSWYIRQAATGDFLRGWEHWERIEGALISYYLRGPLAWLGVVDLGYHSSGERTAFAFRISPWGSRFLGHPATLPAPPEREPIRIERDGTVIVPPGADDWERLHLERLALPLNEGRGATGRYRLDKERLIALIMGGSDPERVIRFLVNASGASLPEPVERDLRQWVTGWGRITIRRRLILEADDPRLFRDLASQPHLARFFERTLNNRTAAIPEEALADLVAALQRAGYLPRVEGHEPES